MFKELYLGGEAFFIMKKENIDRKDKTNINSVMVFWKF